MQSDDPRLDSTLGTVQGARPTERLGGNPMGPYALRPNPGNVPVAPRPAHVTGLSTFTRDWPDAGVGMVQPLTGQYAVAADPRTSPTHAQGHVGSGFQGEPIVQTARDVPDVRRGPTITPTASPSTPERFY